MEKIFNIDKLINKEKDFWEYFETECVSECCGIGAFDFGEENLNRALIDRNKDEVLKYLLDVKIEIGQGDYNIIDSNFINHYDKKEVFVDVLDSLINLLVRKK